MKRIFDEKFKFDELDYDLSNLDFKVRDEIAGMQAMIWAQDGYDYKEYLTLTFGSGDTVNKLIEELNAVSFINYVSKITVEHLEFCYMVTLWRGEYGHTLIPVEWSYY